MQDVWAGKAATKRFHKVIARLLADIRRQRPAESTFAAHLLDIVDPRTGATLTDEFLQPEIALLFLAGFESALPSCSAPRSLPNLVSGHHGLSSAHSILTPTLPHQGLTFLALLP